MTATRPGTPNAHDSQHDDETVIDTVRELAADNDNLDGLGGGVAPERVAEALNRSEDNTSRRLFQLSERDRLVRVDGVNPDNGTARKSYLPRRHATLDPFEVNLD